MTPNRMLALMQPMLQVMIILFVFGALYTWASHDSEGEEDNEFSVTVTYDCTRVLRTREYPSEIISECLDLRNEIQRRSHK